MPQQVETALRMLPDGVNRELATGARLARVRVGQPVVSVEQTPYRLGSVLYFGSALLTTGFCLVGKYLER